MTAPLDLSRLSPAPWSSVKQMGESLIPTGKFILAHGMTAIAVFDNEEDCDFAALARNAVEVMTRRGWTASETGVRWFIDLTPKLTASLKTVAARKWFLSTPFTDPFTALVKADEWYRENVEKGPTP